VSTLQPAPEQFEALAARPPDEPVVMVNLLQFTDGGRTSYLRYAHESGPHLQRVGGTVRYAGTSPRRSPVTVKSLGGMPLSWWNTLRRRRSSNEEYLKIHDHRVNALDRGDLIATSTWTVADWHDVPDHRNRMHVQPDLRALL